MLVIGIVALVALATVKLARNPPSPTFPPGRSIASPNPVSSFVRDINADGWCWWPATRLLQTVEGMKVLHDSDLKTAVALGLIDPDSLTPITELAIGLDPAKSYRCKEI